MNKSFFILLVALCIGSTSVEAQILRNVKKKIEKKAEQVVDRTLDNMGKERDSNDTANPPSNSRANSSTASSAQQAGPFKNLAPMAYDFERGANLIFADDFARDDDGRMASRWTSNGTGTVSEVEGMPGKWLQLFDKNTYKIKELYRLPKDFTLEFDVLTFCGTEPKFDLSFGFDYQSGVGNHYFLPARNPINIRASYRFNRFEITSNEWDPYKASEIEANMSFFVNDVMKVKLVVQGERMHAYVNETKILDTEMLDVNSRKYFYLALNSDAPQARVYISNVLIYGV